MVTNKNSKKLHANLNKCQVENCSTLLGVSGQLPPEEICSPVRVGIWVKVRVNLGLGGNQAIAPEENFPLVRLSVWVRVSFEVGREGNFPWG